MSADTRPARSSDANVGPVRRLAATVIIFTTACGIPTGTGNTEQSKSEPSGSKTTAKDVKKRISDEDINKNLELVNGLIRWVFLEDFISSVPRSVVHRRSTTAEALIGSITPQRSTGELFDITGQSGGTLQVSYSPEDRQNDWQWRLQPLIPNNGVVRGSVLISAQFNEAHEPVEELEIKMKINKPALTTEEQIQDYLKNAGIFNTQFLENFSQWTPANNSTEEKMRSVVFLKNGGSVIMELTPEGGLSIDISTSNPID